MPFITEKTTIDKILAAMDTLTEVHYTTLSPGRRRVRETCAQGSRPFHGVEPSL